jgi:hypothetical protein
MLYNVFKHTNYGLAKFYERVEELKTKKKPRGTKESRAKRAAKKRATRKQNHLEAIRSGEAGAIKMLNGTTSEVQAKHVHPRSKRTA